MSSINRSLTGPMLMFDLDKQVELLYKDEAYQRSGRAGRTLMKSGRLRVTLTAIAAGNLVGTHQADSPLTVHVLKGHIRFRMNGDLHDLKQDQLLFFGPGDAHDVRAEEDSVVLFTISALGDDYLMDTPSAAEAPQHGVPPE